MMKIMTKWQKRTKEVRNKQQAWEMKTAEKTVVSKPHEKRPLANPRI
jgi:hypothetical protein